MFIGRPLSPVLTTDLRNNGDPVKLGDKALLGGKTYVIALLYNIARMELANKRSQTGDHELDYPNLWWFEILKTNK